MPIHAALPIYFQGEEALNNAYLQGDQDGYRIGHQDGIEEQAAADLKRCDECRKATQDLAYNAGIRRGTEITLEDYQYPCAGCGELIMPSKEDLLKAFRNWGHEGCIR